MLIGPHFHEFGPQREDKLRDLRFPIATALHDDWDYYYRYDRPDTVWVVRIYHPDAMFNKPEQWANRCHKEMLRITAKAGGDPRRFVMVGANELKLGVEHGGHGWEVWDDRPHADLVLDWWRRFLAAVRSFGPAYRVGAPAESPGHNDTDGYNDVRRYAAAGIYDLIDVYIAHFYAEGPERGGFDQPDRIYYADRVLTLRQQLDETHPNLPIIISECNRKDVTVGDPLAEFERYCERIKDAVEGITWFVWSSGDAGFATFQLSAIADRLPQLQGIIDRFAIGQPTPPPPDPQPEQPPVSNDEIARIEAKYGITHTDGAEFYLAALEERPDPASISAAGPADALVVVATMDNLPTRTNNNWAEGMGHADLSFNHDAAYELSKGQHGFFFARCGDAIVKGLGWAIIPNDKNSDGSTPPHRNVVPHFARRARVPVEPPTNPPVPPQVERQVNGFMVRFGFLSAYDADPAGIGLPISPQISSGQWMGEPDVPDGKKRQVQFFQRATLYWTGSEVKRL